MADESITFYRGNRFTRRKILKNTVPTNASPIPAESLDAISGASLKRIDVLVYQFRQLASLMASKKDDSFAFGNLARLVISVTNEVVALIRLSFIPMNQNPPPLLANNNELHSSLAIISDNTDHKAYAIRAHLSPILLWLAERYPNVNTI